MRRQPPESAYSVDGGQRELPIMGERFSQRVEPLQ